MKRITVVAVLLVLTTSLTAQEKSFFISTVGGFTQPYATLDFTSYYKSGAGFAGEVGYHYNNKMSFLGALSYNTFRIDEEGSLRDRGMTGLDITITSDPAEITTFTGHVRLKVKETTEEPVMYFDAGMGAQRVFYPEFTAEADDDKLVISEDTNYQFLLSFGAGLDFPFSRNLSVIVDGRVMAAIVGNGGAQYFRAGGGLRYTFGN